MSPLALMLQLPAAGLAQPAPQTLGLMTRTPVAATQTDLDVPPGMSRDACEFWFRENERRQAFDALMVERAGG